MTLLRGGGGVGGGNLIYVCLTASTFWESYLPPIGAISGRLRINGWIISKYWLVDVMGRLVAEL